MAMKQISLFFLMLTSLGLSAQKTIYGYIQDSSSGERLVGAYVKIINENVATTTNNYGYFSLQTNKDTSYLYISYVGFTEKIVTVTAAAELPLNIFLPAGYQLKGVKASKKDDKIVNSTQMSSVSMNVNQIKMMPRFMGESDIIKAIQLMPGVKGGSEGSTGLYVRGVVRTKTLFC